MSNTVYTVSLIIFLIAIFAYALTLSKKVKTAKDMMNAGGNLPWYVNSGTLIVTYFGSGALIGGAGLAYSSGYNAIWLYAGGWFSIFLMFVMAKRIRHINAATNSELISWRFGKKTGLVAGIAIFLSELCLVGYNIKSTALIINLTTGLNPDVGAIIAIVFVVLFCLTAGLLSVAWTDYVQSLIIIGAIIISVPILINKGGGWSGIVAAVPPEYFQPLKSFDIVFVLKNFLPTFAFVTMTSAYYQRFNAAKNQKEMSRSVLVWFIGIVFVTTMIMTFAISGAAMITTDYPEGIIMEASKNLLPGVLSLIMIVTSCSILFTTADSFLLSSSTTFMNDIYLKFIDKNADEKKQIKVLRIILVAGGAVSYILVNFFPTILSMIYFTYTMQGGLVILLLAAIYWKRATPQAGFISSILTVLTTIVWEFSGKPFGIATIFPTLIVALISLVVITYLTPAPETRYLEHFQFDERKELENA